MAQALPRFLAASDDALLVRFGTEISMAHHRRVRALTAALEGAALPAVRNLHPAYASLLIRFDPLRTDHAALEAAVVGLLARAEVPAVPRAIEIPVCYGGDFGPDLAAVAEHCRLEPQEVIARHSAPEYLVYFLGFSPGFPYLGGMDPALATPRLPAPRTRVPAGSVAIGGAQTGVYPVATPGGWRVIGRTPLRLFDAGREDPALVRMGDQVRFVPIDTAECARLETER